MARLNTRSLAALVLVVPASLALACGGSESTPIDGTDAGTNADTSTNDGSNPNDGASPVDDSGVSFPDAGIGPPKVVDVTFADKCPAFSPCGGSVVGVWDYESACAEGVWDDAKKACPTLGITSQSGTVQGRLLFTANTVSRSAKVSFSAKINWPAICLQGASCPAAQAALLKVFTTATCAAGPNGSCDCNVTSSTSGSSAGTPYSVQGNQIVVNDGNKFDFCVNGESMSYRWASGPNPEKASFTLKKTK
jgi:hypothetical protein